MVPKRFKSGKAQWWYKRLKAAQLVCAAAIPVVATIDVHAAAMGALGAAVVVLEGISQLNQYAVNWQSYRATAEALKHEKYLYLAHAGPYAGSKDGTPLLADRIEGLISQEHAKWVSAREEADVGKLASSDKWTFTEAEDHQRVWTDDYSNIVGALWRRLRTGED